MIYIIGLLARSGHGKTTVARYLVDQLGAELRSIAGPMKRAMQRVFELSDRQVWGSQADKEAVDPRYGFSTRWLLQRLGAEGLRDEFGDDIHLRALLREIRLAQRDRPGGTTGTRHRLIVVDDVRFPNDARYLAVGGPDYRGVVLKLVCTDAPSPDGPASTHASELGIDLVDPQDIAATLVSSRAQGAEHLFEQVRRALRQEDVARLLHPVLGHPADAQAAADAQIQTDN
ncbi:MAG TPA: hypothetical protein VKO16_03275 [Polyangia bacterium]|jgi:hypothetical protein|nr:hypothetical protein [Polyangia bacterium]